MTNNKQQTSVEWFVEQLQKTRDWQRVINEANQSSSSVRDVVQQAKEMEKEQMEAASKNSEAFADGYSQGYNRALELVKWALSNLIPPHNEQK